MICVFSADCTDFSFNGLGAINPSSCEVTETLNGDWELQLTHPIDEDGKWRKIEIGRILRVPVPRSMTPYVNLPETSIKLDKTSRGVWRATTTAKVRYGPSTIYKILGTYYANTKMSVIGTKYEIVVTVTATGLIRRTYSDTYPTDPPESGTTRVVNTWYKVVMPDGVEGYVQAACASNVYRSQSIQTIIGEVVEQRQLREQPFRIYRVTYELGKITVYARHIFYDMLDNYIASYSAAKTDQAATVLNAMANACEIPIDDYDFHTDLTTTATDYTLENTNPIDALLGDEGFIAKYGGELARDWYDVFIVNRIGQDTNVQIREGKNLTGINYDLDATNAVSRIIPIGTASNGKNLYLSGTKYVESSRASSFAHPKYAELKVDDAKVESGMSTAQARAKMREAAEQAFTDGADMPEVTLDIDFLNVTDTVEYEQYSWLQDIFIGDSVHVIVKSLGVSVAMRMTEYTYDCLLKKYTAMTLGTVADTIETSTISAAQIVSGSIRASKLAIDSVGSGQLQDGSVSSVAIQAAAIQTAHIVDAAITNAKIVDAAISNAKIENGAITNAKIGDGEIGTAKIADAAIGTAKIANGAITNAKIGDAEIGTAKIALAAITNALIANEAVQTAQIKDGSITSAKVVSLNADVINAGTLSTDRLIIRGANGVIYEINAESSGLTPQQLTDDKYKQYINGTVIVAKSITADQIAAASITANEILAGAITSDKIAAGAITTNHIASDVGASLNISSNNSITMLVNGVDTAQSTADTAVENVEEITPTVENVKRWMSFDENGLRQGKSGSVFSTLIDNQGYHIDQSNKVGHVGSFTNNGLETDAIIMGEIKCQRTSKGGWVWKGVD